MISRPALATKPIDLRHPFVFYLGHIPGFLDINLSKYFQEPYTEPKKFADIFERGIDPDMNDPSICHSHSEVPDVWPEVDEILAFRDRVRQRLMDVYKVEMKDMSRCLGRILHMTFEHEVMHLETILYMMMQSPQVLPPAGIPVPQWQPSPKTATPSKMVAIPGGTITLGHNDDESLDAVNDTSAPYGWDNERPERTVTLSPFRIQQRPVTNGEYLNFMVRTLSKDYPESWIAIATETFQYTVRTVFGNVSMDIARNWPVMCSQDQATKYADWSGMRLPSEEELRALYDSVPFDQGNIGFKNWHPVDVVDGQTKGIGDGWEWTSTEFDAHDGFRESELYPGYSKDFFDHKHVVILGGSWATHPRVAGRRTFRNWYQRGYPYVFCGFRMCEV